MEESNQIQELNQTMHDGFSDVSIAIDNLRFPIENNSSGNGNSILLIILIFVLISINKNLKKLVELNYRKKE